MESSENGNPTYISLRASSKGKYLWKRTKLKEEIFLNPIKSQILVIRVPSIPSEDT